MFPVSGIRGVQVVRSFFGGRLNLVSRNYVRKITPLSIVPRKQPHRKQENPSRNDDDDFDPEMLERIRALDDTDLEPSMQQLSNSVDFIEREEAESWNKMQKHRMTQRHFKPFMEKEVTVLTYAEKQKIKFLHKSNPEEWSIEALAQAFPITEFGVSKLLKSKFQCRFPEDIVEHDKYLVEKLRKIRAGKIKLSPELQEKMALRNAMPLNLGATSVPEIGSLVPVSKPKTLGAFARLVAKPGSIEEPQPSASEPLYLRRGKQVKETTQPPQPLRPLENYDSRLDLDENDRVKSLNLDTNERMTMEDFEAKLRSLDAGSVENIGEEDSKQIRYLLNTKRQVPVPDPKQNSIDESQFSNSAYRPPTIQEYVDFRLVTKFKRDLEEPEKVEVTVDRGRPYIYDSQLGYQKPFGSESPNQINIPANAKKEGSVYRVGDSYYDERGEFLYRII